MTDVSRDKSQSGDPIGKGHITIGVTPMDHPPTDRAAHRERIMRRHNEAADEVTVLVPVGRGREAARLIWDALGSAPTQSAAEFELDQATAYEGNIGRMFGSL
jgi:hypothetical protein